MPTLPGRESSILSVVADHVAVLDRPTDATPEHSPEHQPGVRTRVFDWRSLAQSARPGGGSESQRAQASRFARIREAVERWADGLGISREHLEESSFYATVCTAPSASHEQAVALALGVYWIYLLDDFLDRRDFSALGPAGQDGIRAMDRELDAILEPLAAHSSGRTPPVGSHVSSADDGEEAPLTVELLRAALCSLLASLERAWQDVEPGSPRGAAETGCRRRLIAQEFQACAAAMRQEALWNAALASSPADPHLPPFEDYLFCGSISIGMPAVAAMLATFDPAPDTAWATASQAIADGGSVVRLTNDLHTYFADVEEGKVSAITIHLRDLGYPPTGLDPEASAEVREAQIAVARALGHVVERFGVGCMRLPEGPLAHGVSHAVAFALAVYGDGSQFRAPAA